MEKIINNNSPSDKFISILRKAEQGNYISEYQIAECYRTGEGTVRSIMTESYRQNEVNKIRNYARAAKWYIKAAKHDNSKDKVIAKASYYKLGSIYSWLYEANFLYNEKHWYQAFKYFMKAAELNLPIALCRVAEYYENCGYKDEAIEYFNRAADEAYFSYGINNNNYGE